VHEETSPKCDAKYLTPNIAISTKIFTDQSKHLFSKANTTILKPIWNVLAEDQLQENFCFNLFQLLYNLGCEL